MDLRSAIASCALIAWMSSLSLCQPPTPRVAKGEGSMPAVAALAHMILKGGLRSLD
jgi:hypothetical protein